MRCALAISRCPCSAPRLTMTVLSSAALPPPRELRIKLRRQRVQQHRVRKAMPRRHGMLLLLLDYALLVKRFTEQNAMMMRT